MKPSKFAFKALLGAFLISLGIATPLLTFGTNIFSDDFEAYSLGNLHNQGLWSIYGTENQFVVQSDLFKTGEKAVYDNSYDQSSARKFVGYDNKISEGVISSYFYLTENFESGAYYDIVIQGCQAGYGCETDIQVRVEKIDNIWKLRTQKLPSPPEWIDLADLNLLQWYFVSIKFDADSYSVQLDNQSRSEEIPKAEHFGGESRLMMVSQKLKLYFDDISDVENLVLEPTITGVSPESGTEITDLDTNLTIEYSGFDWDIYDGFVVNFRDSKIEAVSNSKQFLKEDLDPSGTGEEIINLQDFGFDQNGDWYLTGIAFGTHLDIESGMFLTTRGVIDFFSDELVLTPYYLTINVEGLPSPYTFEGPEDWYDAHVERFDAPTAFFISFVGLLSPIFEKVGEFGTRVQNMFDQSEAYDRGYGLGEIFPLISGYIQKIDLFFGGFPLASFFKYLILTMLAIFIIRAVMKFIPFFGK